tara:strand:+ start:162 stop:755 length:594 start_codon:yes stop_codon:yes gene_type:complete
MNKVKFIGYYTLNTSYAIEAAKLKASLEELNLDHDIVGVKNLGNWESNTKMKPRVIKDMLDKYPDYSIVYVDSDAIVRSKPELFYSIKEDVGVRYQEFSHRKQPECLSGTIYFANNERSKQLCDLWISKCSSTNIKMLAEQSVLPIAIEEMKAKGLSVMNIPPEYTFIFDTMKKIYPYSDPIIEHFQASRRNRRKVR